MNKKSGMKLGLAVVLLSGVVGQAQADIQYTSETVMAAAENEPKTLARRAVKRNFERDESSVQIGTHTMDLVSIRECGKKQTIKFDPKLKIYTVVPDEPEMVADPGAAPPPPATGKMVMTYAIKPLGEETIAGFPTKHYLVETSVSSSGCAGEGTTELKTEIWVSDIRDSDPCATAFSPASVAQSVSRSDCTIKVEINGDAALYAEISKGLILRQKTYNGEHHLMTTEVTQLSQAALGDEVFVVPAGYKQLSPGEFEDALNEAVARAMAPQVLVVPPGNEVEGE